MSANEGGPQGDINGGPKRPTGEKKLMINALVMSSPGHLAPATLETSRANFHTMFVPHVLGGYDVYHGSAKVGPGVTSGTQFPVNDPLYPVPVLAAATKNLLFGIAASTTYEQP